MRTVRARICVLAAAGLLWAASASALAQNAVNTANVAAPVGIADPTPANNSATDSDPIVAPQLTLTKTANPSPFTVGVAANYTLALTNTGTTATTAVSTITDTVPTGLTIGALPAGCVLNPVGSQTVVCTVAAGLAVSATASFVIPVTPQSSTGGTTLTNTATVSGGGDATCPATGRCSSTTTTPVTGTASLTLNKTASVADTNGNTVTGDAGDTITYAFAATNTGTVTLAPVTITDPLLPGLVCSIATLAPGVTVSCAATGNTYVITAADVAGGSRPNTATATGDAPGTIPDATASDTETVPTSATPVASLTLNKTASVADTNGNTVSGDAGDTITYAFSATNTGTVTLAPVTISDPMLPGLACSIATLAPGATASCAAAGNTYLITAADVTAGSRANTATATGNAPGTIPDPTASDTETVTTAGTPVASLTLNKAATVADTNGNTVIGDAGDTITYAFAATNTGTVTLAPITVADPLLPALNCVIASLAPAATASCAATGNTYVITAADVTAGARANTATANGNAPGTIPDPTASDTETVPTSATPVASLSLNKTATVADTNGNTVTGDAGDTITYAFSATNTGTVTLAPVTVSDPLLPGLVCSIATLGPGATASCAATGNTYVITAADATAGSRANTATATGGAPGTIPDPTASDTETVPTAATPVASLTLNKTATVADTNGNTVIGDAGDVVTYSFSASNTGTVTLAPVTVTDPLLPLLNCVIASLAPATTASCAATGNTYVITAADAGAGSRANTATANGNAPGTIPDPTANDTETVPTSATPTASLTLSKTASIADTNGNTVIGDAGDTITYAFSVTNTGTVMLAPVTITDPLLPALNCSIATLAPGATSSCTATGNAYVITAADMAAGSRANTATATGNAPGTIPDPTTSDTETVSTTATPVALLTMDKTASVADTNGNTVTGDAGDTITYSFSVTNTGTVTLAPVNVTDPLLPGLVCSIATLGPGTTASCAATGNIYVITAADVSAGSRANTATANGNAPGTIPDPAASDTETVPTATTPVASLTLNKTASVADTNGNTVVGDAGDTITYAFSATNTGTVTLAPVTISDPLLPGLVCSIATLAPGATASCVATGNTYLITAADVTAGSRVNTATATGDAPGTIPDPTASDTETVPAAATPVASLTLNKTASVVDTNGNTVTGDAGDTITYGFSATNTGTVTLAPVTVSDPLLPGLVCSIATLAPGATASCAATGNTYVITAADVTAGARANTATATGNAPGTIPDPTASDTETVPTSATPVASLTLDKTASVADTNGNTITGDAGDTITYGFSATNTGTVVFAPVAISDPLLPGLVCSIATLAPGATASCAATANTYVITAADVTTGSRANTATATGDAPGTIPDPGASDTETVPTAATPVASLTLNKTASVADTNGNTITGDAGDTITYAFSATNTGTVTLAPVTVTDPLLPGLACSIATLAPGATASCAATGNTYVITAADVTAGSRANTATATGNAPGTIPDPTASDTETTPTAATPVASLTLDKIATIADSNGNTVIGDPGDTITYAFSVTNTGTVTLAPVTVSDPLLPGLACMIATLAPGTTAVCAATGNTYVITTADATAGSRANTATATGDAPGTIPDPSGSDTETTPTAATPAPAITLDKTAVSGSPYDSVGDVIGYTYLVTNTGNVTINALVVADDRIATVTCTVTTLAPGASTTCTANYTVTQADLDAGTVVNIATATGTPTSGVLTPATDTETVTATVTPALAVTKTATLTTDNGTIGVGNAGDVITYAVIVRNIGNVTVTGLVVVDRFEGGAPVTLGCTPTTLPPGATATCASYMHTITTAEANAGGTLDNAVTASAQAATSGGTTTVTASSSASVGLEADPTTVRVTKTAAPRDVSIGDLVRYTLQIENTGTVDVVDGSIVDTPPAGFTYVENSLTVADDDNAGRLVGTYPIRIDQIDIAADGRATVTYLLRVGAGVRPGTHVNHAYVQDDSATVSNVATAEVQLISDPMLDESLLVGTVFDDRDGDGWQDDGEHGIPGVRIASVEGLLIETDQHGRYHLAGVQGGPWERGRNFILKVDLSTLPPGSMLTTDNPLVRRITPGIPVRFDFGVKLPPGLIEGGQRDIEMELGAVLFNAGSAEIRDEYLPVIDKMAEQVRSHGSGEVVIAANAPDGSHELQALAYDRAKTVQGALLKLLTPEQAAALTISLRTDLADPDSTLLSLGRLSNSTSPVLGTVLFDTDKAAIKPQFKPVIDKIAADIERSGGGTIGVIGHADRRGSDAYNVALGLRRAKAVHEAIAARLSPAARGKLRVEVSDNPKAPVGSNELRSNKAGEL